MPTISIYAAILAILFAVLSVRTIGARRRLKIAIGDSGNSTMLRAMRAHSNFAEYVPLCLLLVYFVEVAGGPTTLVHGLGTILVAGRLAHAYGISQSKEVFAFRVTGMALTLTTLLFAAAHLVVTVATGAQR